MPHSAPPRLISSLDARRLSQGYARPPCRKLTSVSAAECAVSDAGLMSLGSGGCPHLAYVNLGGCDLLTDKGVAALVQGCPKLKVSARRETRVWHSFTDAKADRQVLTAT